MSLKNLFASALLVLVSGLITTQAKADVLITGILDGTLSGATPRAFEFYTSEAIADFEATYQFQYSANTNAYSNVTTALGAIAADSFFYVTNSTARLEEVFGTGLTAHQNGGITPTGNDSGRLLLQSDSSVIDEAYTNVSSTDVYTDSYMYRIDSTSADTAYDASNWSFGGNNLLDNPNNNATAIGNLVPFGTFNFSAVPEPGSMALLIGLGLGAFCVRRRK